MLEEIRKRIGKKKDWKNTFDYNGFDMSKTHSQEETNKSIDEHNKSILELFADSLDVNETMKHLDCWKGGMIWDGDYDLFAGWTSEDIIYWIITKDMEEEVDNENQEEIFRVVTKEQRYKVLKRQRWRCNQCNVQLKYNSNSDWEGKVAHIDHIHPYSKRQNYPNGIKNINELSNLQALCPKCNLSKGKKEVN